ncbi:S-adenosyl-L-methionine-dependent methyltransferase, partial [Pseudomassariella vexata]
VQRNGCTWQAYREDKYFLPNDAVEQERLDLQHESFNLLCDRKLSFAPFRRDQPFTVLDVGTGTGIWAIEFAKQYPHAKVIGTDLSIIQPLEAAPANCHFVREDVEDEWTLDELFDFIHLRLVFTSFSVPLEATTKLFDNLRPGGWVEYHDTVFEIESIDGSSRGIALEKWCKLLNDAATGVGRDWGVARKCKNWLIEAGFVDVVEKQFCCPINPWPVDRKQKRIGQFTHTSPNHLVEAVSLKVLQQGLHMDLDTVRDLWFR